MQTFESALYAADRFAISDWPVRHDLWGSQEIEEPVNWTLYWSFARSSHWSEKYLISLSDCSFGWFSVGFFGCANWTCRLVISSCLSSDNFGQISVFGKLDSIFITLTIDITSRSLAGQIKITCWIVSRQAHCVPWNDRQCSYLGQTLGQTLFKPWSNPNQNWPNEVKPWSNHSQTFLWKYVCVKT